MKRPTVIRKDSLNVHNWKPVKKVGEKKKFI